MMVSLSKNSAKLTVGEIPNVHEVIWAYHMPHMIWASDAACE